MNSLFVFYLRVRIALEYRGVIFGLQWSGLSCYDRFVNDGSASLLRSFDAVFTKRRYDSFSFNPAITLTLGCELRRVSSEYYWEGSCRSEREAPTRVVFQCTLRGWGSYSEQGREWRVGEEQAFLTVLPSEHIYRLPEESPEWGFYWFTIAHPYVVSRLAEALRRHGPVFRVPAGAGLHRQGLSLFERTCQRRFEDAFAEESALFEWMLALERHLHDLAHPKNTRESLLEELSRYTLENLRRSFGIEEVARRQGLSRSHYSHHFKAATGLAPAAWVFSVRLGEVRRLLRESDRPLKDIASETGFADANHLCKAFRRVYHLSPGEYRKGAR